MRYRRRWELTDAERAKVAEVRSRPIGLRDVLRLAVRSPRLTRELVRAALAGAKQSVATDQGVVWAIDAERVRQAVPEAASGACWVDERPFMRVLEPLLTPQLRVLDLGCGAGRLARHVAPEVAELICADLSPLLLAEARQALAEAGNVRFVQSEGVTLAGIADESVDLVFAQGVFSYLDPNPMLAILDEIRRVLHADGRLVFNAYTVDRPGWAARTLSQVRDSAARGRFGGTHFRAYTEAQLRAACATAGLEVERSVYEGEDLYPGGHLACIVLARPRLPSAVESDAKRLTSAGEQR